MKLKLNGYGWKDVRRMKAKKMLVTGVATVGLAMSAMAVPMLQLDVIGGTYVGGQEETIFAPANNSFTVRALYDNTKKPSLPNTFYLSAAIIPATTSPAFGSFDIGTTTFNSANMAYGTPPMDDPAGQSKDNGDLSTHSIFPTWFAEVEFSFISGQTVPSYNTQDGSAGPSGSNLQYVDFQVNIANLILLGDASGYAVHFDLYHQSRKTTDWDVDKFAPYSHDAQSRTVIPSDPTPPVPDASTTVTLMGMAMIGLGALQRRFQKR